MPSGTALPCLNLQQYLFFAGQGNSYGLVQTQPSVRHSVESVEFDYLADFLP